MKAAEKCHAEMLRVLVLAGANANVSDKVRCWAIEVNQLGVHSSMSACSHRACMHECARACLFETPERMDGANEGRSERSR
jgi:hypothetical protein